MKHYELLYILSGKYAEGETSAVAGRIDDIIKKNDGHITFTQVLDRRKLAYPINHEQHGYYVLTEMDLEPKNLNPFERSLRLSGEVVRHQIVSKATVGKPQATPFLSAERAVSRDMSELPEIPELSEITGQTTTQATTTAPKAEVVIETEQPAEAEVEAVEEAPTTVGTDTAEEVVAEDDKSKKDKKTTKYVDLDKKLDEILNNDIL